MSEEGPLWLHEWGEKQEPALRRWGFRCSDGLTPYLWTKDVGEAHVCFHIEVGPELVRLDAYYEDEDCRNPLGKFVLGLAQGSVESALAAARRHAEELRDKYPDLYEALR